jgi:hypothetical protein
MSESDALVLRLCAYVIGGLGLYLLWPLGWKVILAIILIDGSSDALHLASHHKEDF